MTSASPSEQQPPGPTPAEPPHSLAESREELGLRVASNKLLPRSGAKPTAFVADSVVVAATLVVVEVDSVDIGNDFVAKGAYSGYSGADSVESDPNSDNTWGGAGDARAELIEISDDRVSIVADSVDFGVIRAESFTFGSDFPDVDVDSVDVGAVSRRIVSGSDISTDPVNGSSNSVDIGLEFE